MKIRKVHWIKWYPETKPAQVRGLYCATMFHNRTRASGYSDQVTCKNCLKKK